MSATTLHGNCLDVLPTLEAGSVQCCVTSPPYFGLRDYGVDGQLGLEPTLAGYVANLVAVFREVRRVLADDGVVFLNLGDSYAGGKIGRDDNSPADRVWLDSFGNGGGIKLQVEGNNGMARKPTDGLKPKDLMMVPARVALALQDDGWYLRSDIIWHKTAPMPESVQDRPTSAHEHIFLLTKQARYYYDAEAVREPLKLSSLARLSQDLGAQEGSHRANGGGKANGTMKAVMTGAPRKNPDRRTSKGVEGVVDKQRGHGRRHDGFNERWDAMPKEQQQANGANLRNVWSIGPDGFRGAHFAVMPREIARRCVLAGSREGDTVLDPFSGAGTVPLVASRLGRKGIGVELNAEYVSLARRRIYDDAPLFAEGVPA